MNFVEYQKQASKTASYPNVGDDFVYPALGLLAEAGEVADKLKKHIRDNGLHRPSELSSEQRAELGKEMGDVLWYVAQLCSELKLSLDEVAAGNLEKTQSRQERGKISGSGDNR